MQHKGENSGCIVKTAACEFKIKPKYNGTTGVSEKQCCDLVPQSFSGP